MTILITHARVRNALAATRSLGRKGVNVTTSDSIKHSTSFFSKYSNSNFIYPSYLTDEESFIKTLKRYTDNRKIDALLPMSEEAFVLSKYQNVFNPKLAFPFPAYDKMMKIGNKAKLLEHAKTLDVPIPKTIQIKDISEIKKYKNEITFPAVIKLVRGTGSKGLRFVDSFEELVVEYKNLIELYNLTPDSYPIIQEFINGVGWGVSCLFNSGEARAIFTHERIREYPISGGPSTSRISRRHRQMEKIAIKLLEDVDWHGVAMVEFKLDEITKEPYLIEINPRFWGSLNLAICSGVDFPYLFYQMAMEGDIKPVFSYQTGIKSRWILGELRGFIDYLKKGRFNDLEDFFSIKKTHFDDFVLDDPLPFLAEAAVPLNNFIRKGKLKFSPEADQ